MLYLRTDVKFLFPLNKAFSLFAEADVLIEGFLVDLVVVT